MQNREENGSGKMVDVGIVFQKMLMLLVMMTGIGFLAGKTRVMSVESNHMLSLLINKITMPCLVVYSSVCNAHSMSNRELLILLGIYFVSFVLMIVVARLFRLLVSPERGHAGIYELLLIFPTRRSSASPSPRQSMARVRCSICPCTICRFMSRSTATG